MARALERLAVRGVPPARRAVQGGQLLREAVPELGAEHLRQQGVVAEPCARRVERVDEPVRARELAEGGPAVGGAGQRLDQLGVHPLDDRRPEQEPQLVLVVAVQDLGGQVVGHGAVVAGETGDERARVRMPCSDSSASRSAATQPSVRLQSVSTSAGARLERPEELARLVRR